MAFVLKLRLREHQIRTDADLILRSTFNMKERDFEEFFQELVDEGVAQCITNDEGVRFYSATKGPSLYSVIQDKILSDIMEDRGEL